MNAVTQLCQGLCARRLGCHQLSFLLFQRGLLSCQLVQGSGYALFHLLQLRKRRPVAGYQFVAGLKKVAVVGHGPCHGVWAFLVE